MKDWLGFNGAACQQLTPCEEQNTLPAPEADTEHVL